MKYVALLRGINVGGKSVVRMTDLKAVFESAGFTHVRTYIQSGNVVFESRMKSVERIAKAAAGELAARYPFAPAVLVVPETEVRRIVHEAPPQFGADPEAYRYDVMFLFPGISPSNVLRELPVKEGVETAFEGSGVVYVRRLVSRASESRLARFVASPLYRQITVRNWNTTRKLLDLLS